VRDDARREIIAAADSGGDEADRPRRLRIRRRCVGLHYGQTQDEQRNQEQVRAAFQEINANEWHGWRRSDS